MSLDEELETLTHSHDYLGERHDQNARRTLWVVLLTTAMMVAEIAAGLAFNSMALLADGFHMATHAGALGIAALAYAYAKRHARSGRYSFGTGKVGDLAGFASALVLGMVSIGIAVESLARLVDPAPVAFGEAAVIAVIGLAVNIVSVLLLGHGHDDHHGHAHGQDNNLRSAYLHVLADALKHAYDSKFYQDFLVKNGMGPKWMPAAELRQFMVAHDATMGNTLEKLGMKKG